MSTERYKNAVRAVYILGLFVQIVDGTIINVAIPTLADEFAVSESSISWTVTSYLLAIAVFIPAAGWLGDRVGNKRVFMFALGLFTVASVLCGLSATLGQLIAFRVLQGVGTGLMGPIGSAMLYRAYPQEERARIMPTIIAVVVLAPAFGPVLGGLILEFLSWRWIFFVNIPMGAVGVLLAGLWLREYRADERRPFDLIGFVLAGAGLALTVFAVSEGPSLGWTSALIVGAAIVGPVLLVALVLFERWVASPLLKLELFRDRIFRQSNIISFFLQMGFISVIFLLPLYLQSLRGFSALETGLAIMPQPLGVLVSSQLAGKVLYQRLGPRRLIVWGLITTFIVGVLIAQVDMETSLWTIRSLMFARGFFLGFAFIAIQTATYAGTSMADTANATTLFSMQRQTAPAFGVALSATLLSSFVASRTRGLSDASLEATAQELSAYQDAMLITAFAFVVAIVAALFVRDADAASTMGHRERQDADGAVSSKT